MKWSKPVFVCNSDNVRPMYLFGYISKHFSLSTYKTWHYMLIQDGHRLRALFCTLSTHKKGAADPMINTSPFVHYYIPLII